MKWKGTSYSTLDVQENFKQPRGTRELAYIVLDPQMTIPWREGGEIFKVVSSRIVTAK